MTPKDGIALSGHRYVAMDRDEDQPIGPFSDPDADMPVEERAQLDAMLERGHASAVAGLGTPWDACKAELEAMRVAARRSR